MAKKDKITKDAKLGDVVSKHPETIEVMLDYGLHCIGCHVAGWETIEQGAVAHGLSEENIKSLIVDLNKAVEKKK